MVDFLKAVGHGLLGIILAPFYIVLLLLYSVYSLGVFLVYLVRITICDLRNMFSKTGKFVNPFKELPEDILVKQILANEKEAIQNPIDSSKPVQQNVTNITYNIYGMNPNNIPGLNSNQNAQIPTQPPVDSENRIENQNFTPLPNYETTSQQTNKKVHRTSDVSDDDFDGGNV